MRASSSIRMAHSTGPLPPGKPQYHPRMLPDRDVYTVSRLNREVRVALERGFGTLWLEAEISNFSRPASGHWYFSLKDSAAFGGRCVAAYRRDSSSNWTKDYVDFSRGIEWS